jgi:hypothetical protein
VKTKSPSDDVFLRKYGFRIHARPAKGPATWRRGNKLFDHKVALKIAARLEAEAKARGEEDDG